MSARLIPYSRNAIIEVTDRVGMHSNLKPRGLWLSVEGHDDWLRWCVSESFGLMNFAHATQVILSPDANILRIDTERGLDDFTRKYSKQVVRFDMARIDWNAVQRAHDGIIIAPYQWSRRLTLMWYYGWDCASRCIWNARAVEGLRALAAPKVSVAQP